MKVKDIYKEHSKQTIEYMELVVRQIETDYGNVPSSWRVSLDLIADTLEIYFDAMKDIKKNGIYKKDDKGRIAKNQACAIQNVALQNIYKLLSAFGLTPLSANKLKNVDNTDTTLDDLINP